MTVVHLQGQQRQRRDHHPTTHLTMHFAFWVPAALLVRLLRRVALVLFFDEQVTHLRVPVLPRLPAHVMHHLRRIIVVVHVVRRPRRHLLQTRYAVEQSHVPRAPTPLLPP